MLTSLTLQDDARVGPGVILEHGDRPVVRDVVADDELEIGEVLGQHRLDAAPDDIPAVPTARPIERAGDG